MGVYSKARSSDKGIEALLAGARIGYQSLPELGNVFMAYEDWRERYAELLERAGALLTAELERLRPPLCLLCAERKPTECHRWQIAEFLARLGHDIHHLE